MKYRVRELAERKGVTLKQVARETGLNPRVLYSLTGEPGYNTTVKVIERLCKYFGVTPNELLVIDE